MWPYVWRMGGVCVAYVWRMCGHMCGVCVAYVWSYVWRMHGVCVAYVCIIEVQNVRLLGTMIIMIGMHNL